MKVYNVSDGPLPANDAGSILAAGEWGDIDNRRAERYLENKLVVRTADARRTSPRPAAEPDDEPKSTSKSGTKSSSGKSTKGATKSEPKAESADKKTSDKKSSEE